MGRDDEPPGDTDPGGAAGAASPGRRSGCSAQSVGEGSIPGVTKTVGRSTLVGKVGNFSVQYNLAAASICIEIMTSHHDDVIGSSSDGAPVASADFPEPDVFVNILLGTVFAGAVVGMLTMGYLGDLERLGRLRAMMLTLSFIVVGSVGSALAPWGGRYEVYGTLCACRFLVGVGVGGIYPLSASHSAEAGASDDDDASPEEAEAARVDAAGRVGWAFFWQVPGQIAPYTVAMLLFGIHDGDSGFSVDAQFRILLGFGAIPALAVMLLTWREMGAAPEEGCPPQKGAWQQAMRSPQWPRIRTALIGTTSTWFLYDISCYGTSTFMPHILKDIFGSGDKLASVCWQSIVTTMFGLPGAVLGIKVQQWRQSQFNNMWGFVAMGVLFLALAVVYIVWEDGHALLFAIFLLLSTALNAGPSVATFVVPALVFPPAIRNTCHGLSAGAGKLGAVVGTFMYPPLSRRWGFATVMLIQAALSLGGALCTAAFIPPTDAVVGAAPAGAAAGVRRKGAYTLLPARPAGRDERAE